VNDQAVEGIARELTILKLRMAIFEDALGALQGRDPEALERILEEMVTSDDGRRMYETTLLALKRQPPSD
jgi:hypothetical protein